MTMGELIATYQVGRTLAVPTKFQSRQRIDADPLTILLIVIIMGLSAPYIMVNSIKLNQESLSSFKAQQREANLDCQAIFLVFFCSLSTPWSW
jgi:hypothetical protein